MITGGNECVLFVGSQIKSHPPLPQSNVLLSPLVQLERPLYKQPQRRFVDSTQSLSFLDPSSSPRDEMSHVGVDNVDDVDKENEDEVVYGGVNEHAHDIDGQESTADEIEEEGEEEEEEEEEELDVSAEMIEANEFVEAEASSLSQI